jgi:hypothetical protein
MGMKQGEAFSLPPRAVLSLHFGRSGRAMTISGLRVPELTMAITL